jgi:hypothetical protein
MAGSISHMLSVRLQRILFAFKATMMAKTNNTRRLVGDFKLEMRPHDKASRARRDPSAVKIVCLP